MESSIIKLKEELEYETHLLSKGFYSGKTQEDRDGTELDCKNRIKSYERAINALVKYR